METTEATKYDFDRVVRLVFTIIGIAAIILGIQYLSPVLLPFLVGCILAYVLDPLVRLVQRVLHMRGRAVPVLITLALVIGGLTLVGWLLVPYLVDEFAYMAKLLAAYAKSSLKIPYVPAGVHEFVRQYLDFERIINLLSGDQWMNLLNNVATGTWSFVGGTMSIVLSAVSWLIVLLYMFFVLMDYDKISKLFKGSIPPKYRRMSFRILSDVTDTMSRYFRGQALVSLCVGIIFAIEFYIIGLPMAIVFGLSIGVLNMVPYLQLVSIPVAAFLCLVASVATGGGFWGLFGWTIAAYILCQAIQDMVLIPCIMKQQMGLNPAIIFLALSLWAYILGFVGLIIGLPLTTLIISYYCEYVLGQPNPLRKKKK